MNYFQPCSLSPDETILAAWDSQVSGAADAPWLEQILAERGSELFPQFAARYAELRHHDPGEEQHRAHDCQ